MPVMIVGLLVGLVISLFQALTQIQERRCSTCRRLPQSSVRSLFLLPFMVMRWAAFMARIASPHHHGRGVGTNSFGKGRRHHRIMGGMTISILPEFALAFMLVFARVGTDEMLLPAWASRWQPQRVRLGLRAVRHIAHIAQCAAPLSPVGLNLDVAVRLLITEILIGVTFGLSGRFLMSSLQTAGVLISQQSPLVHDGALTPPVVIAARRRPGHVPLLAGCFADPRLEPASRGDCGIVDSYSRCGRHAAAKR